MIQIIEVLISAVLQIGIFTLIPFLFFIFRKNKSQSFIQYIGFIKPSNKSIYIGLSVCIIFILIGVSLAYLGNGIRKLYHSGNTVTGFLHEMGISPTSISILLITALFKTSLSEEILFRGFIARQLISKIGFKKGNLLQAIIFGAIHFVLFLFQTRVPLMLCIGISIFSLVAAWFLGHNMVKNAHGSIIPGWISHGLGNTISYTIISFIL